MRARRDAAIRLLRTALVATIVIPLAILCWGTWVTYNNAFAHADEQLSATMDVLAEQANTVFESVGLTFTSVDTLVGAMSDDQISASEQALHDKLHELESGDGSGQRHPRPRQRWAYPGQFTGDASSQRTEPFRPGLFQGAGYQRCRYIHRFGTGATGFRESLLWRQSAPAFAERTILRRRRCIGRSPRSSPISFHASFGTPAATMSCSRPMATFSPAIRHRPTASIGSPRKAASCTSSRKAPRGGLLPRDRRSMASTAESAYAN